ncbi:DUF642 domain-containing protein [Sorangium sp. So ce291]|uniref:DUF642 domain-containing protein n=1 Tax=Sorangium sp. So ce291 TaxID=3133294 RepID=UPI003F617707
MQIDSYNGGQKVCTGLDPDPGPCEPGLVTGQTVAPGVQYYDCTSTTTKVHIVTIDRNRPEYEMWILDDPTIRNPPSNVFNLQTVPDFAASYNALAAVNGYVWSGDEGTDSGQTGTPQTTLYETGIHYTSNTSTCSGFPGSCPEVLMGFTPQSGNGLDVSRIPQDDLSEPANQKYTYTLYGSNSTVMNSDGCTSDTTNNRWSVIGYSPTQIVLLSTATDVGLTHAEICPVLSAFGVEEAVRQDGSSAAGMFVGGSINEHVNPLVNIDHLYYRGQARHVAYAVGLVQLHPRQVQNSGFEAPALSPGEAWRRMTGASQETTLTGWNGPVDLHGATDLVAHGQQIIDLNQSGSGYVETTLATPADTHCLLHFYHGVNHHCNQQATFTVDIDGTSVASFTSTYDPNSLQEARVRFKTTGTTATLRFTSTTGGCGAATIDDVSVACTKQ